MHIETSADARQSRRHDAGGGLAGPAADDRGYLAAAASRFSLWWHGDRRPPALTADTASGAGLQGGTADVVPQSNGDANLAPSEGYDTPTTSNPDRIISDILKYPKALKAISRKCRRIPRIRLCFGGSRYY